MPPRSKPPPARPRRAPKQDRALATVAALLDAMAASLVERGFEATTTNYVAERAGVNIGSLYQYFPSKGALLASLAQRQMDRYEEAMGAAEARVAGAGLEAGIAELLRSHVEALAAAAALHVALLPHLRSGELAVVYAALKERMVAGVARYLSARRAEVGPEDPKVAARTAVDCVEAVTLGALVESRERLAEAKGVGELYRLAKRYLGREG